MSPIRILHDLARRRIVSWPLIAALVAYVTAVVSPTLLADPDTLWHVTAGDWMFANGKVPQTDPFSFTKYGAPWIAHEWLSELLMSALHGTGGWQTLQLAVAASFAWTLAVTTRFLCAYLQPVHLVTTLALTWVMLASHLLARPHVFVWPLMAIWCIQHIRAIEQQRRPAWWLAGVLLLWTNLHGSYVLGIALMVGFGVEAIWTAGRETRSKTAQQWLLFILVSTGMTLVNPQGWQSLGHVVSVMRMRVALQYITEWQSTDFHQLQPLLIWLVLAFGLAFTGRLKLTAPRAGLLFGMLYLALKHERYHSLFGLTAPLLMAAALRDALHRTSASDQPRTLVADRLFEALIPRMHLRWAVGAWMVALVVTVAGFRLSTLAPDPGISPTKALAAAESAGLTGRVFNHYNFGGFLIYRRIPVFVDGRADMYGDEFIRSMRDAAWLTARDSLPALLDRYAIDWTLLTPGTPATQLLDYLPGWRRVYSDSLAVVHARRSASRSVTATTKSLGPSLDPSR